MILIIMINNGNSNSTNKKKQKSKQGKQNNIVESWAVLFAIIFYVAFSSFRYISGANICLFVASVLPWISWYAATYCIYFLCLSYNC